MTHLKICLYPILCALLSSCWDLSSSHQQSVVEAIGVDSIQMTQKESVLFHELVSHRGRPGLAAFLEARAQSFLLADEFFPTTDASGNPVYGAEDGHHNAFRHAYWNVLLTASFGADFAESFATANEGMPSNLPERGTMHLFNNNLGRQIAKKNPNASVAQLAQLVADAVNEGEAVVIDSEGKLAYSNDVAVGSTGFTVKAPAARVEVLPLSGSSLD